MTNVRRTCKPAPSHPLSAQREPDRLIACQPLHRPHPSPPRPAGRRAGYATAMSSLVAALRTVVLVPLFFVLTLGIAAWITIAGSIRHDPPSSDRVIQFWARRFIGIPPVTVELAGIEDIDPDQQYVVVSNHLSNFDIPVLFTSLPLTLRFLAKQELMKIPLVGHAMKVVGIVMIDRSAGISAHQAINEGVARARDRGFSLVVFAEGTRSRTGEMADFKKGGFRIAIDAAMPVLPVVVAGTFEANPPGAWLIRPAAAKVRVLSPIDTNGMTIKDDAVRLMKTVREDMLAVYEELRTDDGRSERAQS